MRAGRSSYILQVHFFSVLDYPGQWSPLKYSKSKLSACVYAQAIMSCILCYSARRMSSDSNVNLYQSHVQTFQGSAMPSAIKRSNSESQYNTDSLAASLNKAFYITSYQSDISKKAGWLSEIC